MFETSPEVPRSISEASQKQVSAPRRIRACSIFDGRRELPASICTEWDRAGQKADTQTAQRKAQKMGKQFNYVAYLHIKKQTKENDEIWAS